ncbi:hypothetical protein L596_002142 [Steinernema carpocapsae]|uniref:Uncharacterized protein n=1 Tax=Steinernema carpocapsae TaxID=34508 RepID=A0A4U8UNT9_STECR|nr:hypothetical protein L596_002142 [Steinernema carpocapsae]
MRSQEPELDVEKGKKQAPATDEEDEEGDYAEAEIDSTDSLKPTLTEMFGEQLLLKKFRQSGAPPILVDEKLDTLPPGTVPRRPPGSRRQQTSTVGSKKGRQPPVPTLPSTSQKPSDGAESRGSSMMSHATFILENDKRKPLLADNGLKSVSSQQLLKVARNGTERKRTKVNTKEFHDSSATEDLSDRPSVSEPLPPAQPPAQPKPVPATKIRPPKRSDSEGRQIKERSLTTPGSNCKAASTSVLHTLPADSAPVSTNLPRRIPNDANSDEYIAAFGSRPKVMRTPDNAHHASSPKKSVMMMY